MKKVYITIIASGLVAAVASAGTSVNVDFATAYVFRGATVVDELVVQPGVEVDGFGIPAEAGSLALGVWGNAAPFADGYDNLTETDWYLVYTLPQLVSNLTLSVGLTEYQYVLPLGEQEISIGAGYELGDFMLGATANFMVDDANPLTESQKYFDFFADYALEVSENFEVNLGALMSVMLQGDGNSALGLDDGFNHYELYGEFSYPVNEMWGIGASLNYIGQLDSNVLPDAAHDKGLVAMFSVGCSM